MRLTSTLAALVLTLAGAAAPAPAQDGFGAALNDLRGRSGAAALRADPRLVAAAQGHAEAMARRGQLTHVGADGATHIARAQAAGCRTFYVAENIAFGQPDAGATLAAWMASPPHRANILGRGYGAYGLGTAGGMWVILVADRC